MALELDRVTKYPPVLSDVCARFGEGVHLLAGANGAGKTTLLRVAAGLLQPDGGMVRWRGLPVAADPVGFRRRLGYLPQRQAAYPEMTAGALLDYVAELKSIPRALARPRRDEVLSALGLAMVTNQPMAALSEGARRLVSLAQALLNDPDLLLLDEPFEGLDPDSRHRTLGLLARPGRVTIVASHRTELLLAGSTAVWRLASGRLEKESPVCRFS